MRIALDPEHLALRAELQGVLRPARHPRASGPAWPRRPASSARPASTRRSSARSAPTAGSGIGWPKEYGGQARSMIEQLIFTDAAAVAGVPIPYLTLNTVGPTIMRYGTDEQKEFFLPKILAGDLHFSIGYSEPGSGTDLASLKTKAAREGDEWVINGQKMWTSLIQYADWIWLACRTDPDLPRHKGLSMILVPAQAPGCLLHARCTRWPASAPARRTTRTCACPRRNLVGELNGGWSLMTNQLNHERVSLTSAAPLDALAQAGARVGAADQEPRRPAGHRHRVGADRPRPRARPGRGAHAAQLEAGRRRRRRGRPLPRRGLGDQDLRLRAGHRGLPLADGDRRPERRHHRRLRGRGARRPARALLPLRAGDDLRRRHQRDPARHHRLRRPRPARPRSDDGPRTTMDFTFTPEQDEAAAAGRPDPRRPGHQRAA